MPRLMSYGTYFRTYAKERGCPVGELGDLAVWEFIINHQTEAKIDTLNTRLGLAAQQRERALTRSLIPEWPFKEVKPNLALDHLERKMRRFAVELRNLGEQVDPVPGEADFK